MSHFAQQVALRLLRAYKWAISPLFPPACRYVPTCSEYAMEAVERYGVLRGTWMGFVRIMRCHPFVKGGYDPVVKRTSTRKIGAPGAAWNSDAHELTWKSGALAPRPGAAKMGFSPCDSSKNVLMDL